MTRRDVSRNPIRTAFGLLLFAIWTVESVVWVTSTVELVKEGDIAAGVTAALTIALLVLLAGMEGLEVAVIDRWREMFAGEQTSSLAAWLSARQLFVALIVTGTTLLSRRSNLTVPFLDRQIPHGAWAVLFDLTWTGLAVLWFGQILPKALAANNSARYLKLLRKPLFPLVSFVRAVGVSQPGEWTASLITRRAGWAPPEDPLTPASVSSSEQLLVQGWRAVAAPTTMSDSRAETETRAAKEKGESE